MGITKGIMPNEYVIPPTKIKIKKPKSLTKSCGKKKSPLHPKII